jgi:hypothetical protein
VIGAYKMGASTGVDNIRFVYAIKLHSAHAQVLRRGYSDETVAELRRSYNKFARQRSAIHRRFGDELEWRPPTHSHNWHIVAPIGGGGLLDVERWADIQDDMIETMHRLERAVAPILDDIERARRKRTAKPTVPTFAKPYRHVDVERGAERDPFIVDPERIERGNRSHRELQETLAKLAKRNGVTPLSPGAVDPDFDIAWRQGATLVIVECKSTTDRNQETQIRLGLGQVLEYAYRARPASKRRAPAIRSLV